MTKQLRKPDDSGGPAFESPEGLRALLIRLHKAGPGSWRHDKEAHELSSYIARKYSRLARKHGLNPWEAVTLAFEAMLQDSVRTAKNPWAAITTIVKLKCYYEERAQGLLCSVDDASVGAATFHDAERFADRDQSLLEYRAELRAAESPLLAASEASGPAPDDIESAQMPSPVKAAISNAVTTFVLLGWPLSRAEDVIEYICLTLGRMGNRASAIEALRRDTHARAILDVGRKPWNAAVWVMLGTPNEAYSATKRGRGLLMRLVLGEPLEDVFADDALVRRIVKTAPAPPPLSGLP